MVYERQQALGLGTSTYGPPPGFVTGGPNPSYSVDACCPNKCSGKNRRSSEALAPPLGQPPQSLRRFHTSWPLNSWSVTENSDGYQSAYIACSRSSSRGSPVRSTAEPPPMQQASPMRLGAPTRARPTRAPPMGARPTSGPPCEPRPARWIGRLSSPGTDGLRGTEKTEGDSKTKRCRLAAGVAGFIRECRLDSTTAKGIHPAEASRIAGFLSRNVSTPACRPPTRRSTARPRYSNTPASSGTAATSSLTSSRAWETSAGEIRHLRRHRRPPGAAFAAFSAGNLCALARHLGGQHLWPHAAPEVGRSRRFVHGAATQGDCPARLR